MKNKEIKLTYFGILLLILAIGLTSCQVDSATETDLVSQSDSDSTETLEITLEPEPVAAEVSVEEQESDNKDECLLCHTYKETLLDTANPVAVIDSESSGEG
jgi:hypothetical protein